LLARGVLWRRGMNSTSKLGLFTFFISTIFGCSSNDAADNAAESASAVTVTSGPWTGVYDLGPKNRNVVPRGTLRIVSQRPDKLI